VSGWDELVSAALLGTERHPVDVGGLPGPVATVASGLSESDSRLLGAAALATNYRRAGVRALAAVPAPPVAEPESARVVGSAAAIRLDRLLGRNDAELLHEWLIAVAARGLRPPVEALPALLDTAARQPSVGVVLARVLGARGRWLAGFRPEWAQVVAEPPVPTDPAVWTHGEAAPRRAYLAGLRERDPDAARELLAGTWQTEPAAERVQLLAVLGAGLSTSDEPMLEAALDDRSVRVRHLAAGLLAQLPISAYADRMWDRLRSWVRRDGDRVVVTPPAECDAAMLRDAIVPTPQGPMAAGPSVGPRAWWLRQVIETAPLAGWSDLLGVDPTAALALPVEGGWSVTLRDGWAAAAARQRDPQWATALLGLDDVDPYPLLNALPPAQRADAVALRLSAAPTEGHTLLALCPGPWPPLLVDRVLAMLTGQTAAPQTLGLPVVLRLVAHRLPPDAAPRVATVAAGYDPTSPWPAQLAAVVDLLTFRSQLHEEIR
jgi:Family of unknown function (DUF5691)